MDTYDDLKRFSDKTGHGFVNFKNISSHASKSISSHASNHFGRARATSVFKEVASAKVEETKIEVAPEPLNTSSQIGERSGSDYALFNQVATANSNETRKESKPEVIAEEASQPSIMSAVSEDTSEPSIMSAMSEGTSSEPSVMSAMSEDTSEPSIMSAMSEKSSEVTPSTESKEVVPAGNATIVQNHRTVVIPESPERKQSGIAILDAVSDISSVKKADKSSDKKQKPKKEGIFFALAERGV
ncbi:hypothetical protein L3Q72_08320 [Vibrio sp. JC009]|uniref:hypothetical protein n=1 Tax=Vibrio sp. JC009 TaxID=2912314 RepID=UPI0023B015D5|nr:hypothetical protein [Vibrio sp. JC009]WED20655.1 hypothetical protein L3Q72_08320 [Vibrio sp. JC009]